VLKIVGVALVCAILILYLRSVNNELALPATIGSGIIILYLALSYVADTFTVISSLIDMTKVDGTYFGIIFKITAIGYLVEFGAGAVEDFGLKSLADKLVFAGKIIILGVSMPIIYAVINLLSGILN